MLDAEGDDVDEEEEVAGEPELVDHVELVGELARGPLVVGVAGRVAHRGAAGGELPEPGHVGVPGRDVEVGQVGGGEPQVERAGGGDLDGAFDRARPAREPAGLLGGTAELREGGAGQPAVELVEGASGPDRGQRGGERPLPAGGVVDVVGGDHLHPGPGGEQGEGVVAVTVERVAVIPEFDEHPVPPERVDEPLEGPARRGGPLVEQRARHRALPAPGEDHPGVVGGAGPVAVEPHPGPGRLRQRLDREARAALLAGQLTVADGPGQPSVAERPFGQDEQVLARGIGDPVGGAAGVEGELGAEDGRQAHREGRLGEPHDAVEAVVVGDRQGAQSEAGGLVGQLLGVAGPVEEREVRMAMQLGVRHQPASAPGAARYRTPVRPRNRGA